MKKLDIIFGLVTGEVVALYAIYLFEKPIFWALAVIFPILAVVCLWVAYKIGQKFLFVYQLAKFLLIGALATIFDLGTLGFFVAYFGVGNGLYFDLFKGISFVIATIGKYIPDKFWAFEKKETEGAGKEFTQFFIVTFVGFFINVGIAHVIVNIIGPQFGLSDKLWVAAGGIGAVLVTFAWNFGGYKFLVFKK